MKMPDITMENARNLALGSIVALNAVATITSFGESYYGNFRWADTHEITGFAGAMWPLMIDLIILVAEAGLFVAHHDGWKLRHRIWLWFIMLITLGVSVGANTGHVLSSDYLTHLTAALAPVALMFTTTVGFGVMKRTFMHRPVPAARPAERVHAGTGPWFESAALAASHAPAETVLTPVSQPRTETFSQPVSIPELEDETEPAAVPEMTDPRLSETMVKLGFKVTEKSYSQPPDSRQGLNAAEMRVRDMYDLDPDIPVNQIAQNLGIAWATAKKYLEATKEARSITT